MPLNNKLCERRAQKRHDKQAHYRNSMRNKEVNMTKLTQRLLVVICMGISLVSFVGCEEDGSGSGSGSLIGTWQSGSSKLYFYDESRGNEYVQTLNDGIFDRGTYKASDGHITMNSKGGHSSSGDYTIFDNGTKLNGFTGVYGNKTTYHKL